MTPAALPRYEREAVGRDFLWQLRDRRTKIRGQVGPALYICMMLGYRAADSRRERDPRPRYHPAPSHAGRYLRAHRCQLHRLLLRADPRARGPRAALLPLRDRAGPLLPSRMGASDRPAGGRLLAVPHLHVPAWRLGPPHRQHVDALDLRRQRRGSHGHGPLPDLLPPHGPALRSHALAHQRPIDRAHRGSIGSDRGSAGRLLRPLPTLADRRAAADLLLPLLLPVARGPLSPLLVPQPGAERDARRLDGFAGGRNRVLGARRRLRRRRRASPAVHLA